MELQEQVEIITNHIELSCFIDKLREDLHNHPESWSNSSLEDFLEALSAWIGDMEGYYINNSKPIPEQPLWKNFAEILLAAKYYE